MTSIKKEPADNPLSRTSFSHQIIPLKSLIATFALGTFFIFAAGLVNYWAAASVAFCLACLMLVLQPRESQADKSTSTSGKGRKPVEPSRDFVSRTPSVSVPISAPLQDTPDALFGSASLSKADENSDPICLVKALSLSEQSISERTNTQMDWESSKSRSSSSIFSARTTQQTQDKSSWSFGSPIQSSFTRHPKKIEDPKPVNIRLDTNPSLLNPKLFAKTAFKHVYKTSSTAIPPGRSGPKFNLGPTNLVQKEPRTVEFSPASFVAPSLETGLEDLLGNSCNIKEDTTAISNTKWSLSYLSFTWLMSTLVGLCALWMVLAETP